MNVAEMPEMTLRYEWEGKKYIAHLAIMRIEEDPC